MARKYQILIVDDDQSITFLLQTEFEQFPEYEVETAHNGTDAINLLQKKIFDVALLDIKMPRVSGIDVLKFISEHSPTTQAIMLTNVVDVKTAFDTFKYGAYDFVSKPYDTDQLMATVRRAVERRELVIEKEVMKLELNRFGANTLLVGESKKLKDVIAHARQIAASDSFVLIQGPSGTGKELLAHLVHRESPRKERPFVPVNCASIPDQLLESELFGHERGAFTNAYAAKQGLVEVANGGTLFLDEVGDISPVTQPKLLRFLETGEFRRVGGTVAMRTDVRVVSATNKNLQEEVRAGRMREDLLYRLNIVIITVPPLKDRKEDIPTLVDFFLQRKSKTKPKQISQQALEALLAYDWPGNVRELEHVIEGAAALCQGDVLQAKDLWVNASLRSTAEAPPAASAMPDAVPMGQRVQELVSLEEIEKRHIQKTLEALEWNRSKTADALGITPKTLYLKIKKYGLQEPG
jgi:two-component system, NtrC family, response regulator AtoC